jgi:alpha-glucosidase (family GH31 glycosyl hydrolase)
MPLYVKAGSIIPMDPVKQYTGEEVNEPLTVRIYTGASGSFSLYEDDGISQQYLKGDYTVTKFSWDDTAGKITISPVAGNVAGTAVRKFVFELMPAGTRINATWEGEEFRVSL